MNLKFLPRPFAVFPPLWFDDEEGLGSEKSRSYTTTLDLVAKILFFKLFPFPFDFLLIAARIFQEFPGRRPTNNL